MSNTTSRIFAICASLCVILLTLATGYICYRAVIASIDGMPNNVSSSASSENETVGRSSNEPVVDDPVKPRLTTKSDSNRNPSTSMPSLPTRRAATKSGDDARPANVKRKPAIATAPDQGPSTRISEPFADTNTEEYVNPLMFFPDDIKNRIWWEIADVARQTRDRSWSLSIGSANSVALKYNVNATAIYHFFQVGANADWRKDP